MEKNYVTITKYADYDASFYSEGNTVSFSVYEDGSRVYEQEMTKSELVELIENLQKLLMTLGD